MEIGHVDGSNVTVYPCVVVTIRVAGVGGNVAEVIDTGEGIAGMVVAVSVWLGSGVVVGAGAVAVGKTGVAVMVDGSISNGCWLHAPSRPANIRKLRTSL